MFPSAPLLARGGALATRNREPSAARAVGTNGAAGHTVGYTGQLQEIEDDEESVTIPAGHTVGYISQLQRIPTEPADHTVGYTSLQPAFIRSA